MFAFYEPLQLVNRTFEEDIKVGLTLTPMFFLQPKYGFFVGTLGEDSQVTVLIAQDSILRENILQSYERPRLKSLLCFENSDESTGLRAMHNVAKIWEWYSATNQMMRLLFESDTGRIFGKGAGLEPLDNKKLLWSLPAQSA